MQSLAETLAWSFKLFYKSISALWCFNKCSRSEMTGAIFCFYFISVPSRCLPSLFFIFCYLHFKLLMAPIIFYYHLLFILDTVIILTMSTSFFRHYLANWHQRDEECFFFFVDTWSTKEYQDNRRQHTVTC